MVGLVVVETPECWRALPQYHAWVWRSNVAIAGSMERRASRFMTYCCECPSARCLVRRREQLVRRKEKVVRRTEKVVRRTEKVVWRTEIILWGHRTRGVVLGGSCSGGSCPWGSCLWGSCPRGQFSWKQLC